MIPKLPKNRHSRRSPTASSNVAGHSYNTATGQLDITFHSGRTYRYHDVPVKTASDFSNSESRGRFVHEKLIPHHDVTEITNKPER